MTTFDRKKLNTKFEYPMELDMSKYLDQSDDTAAHEQAKDPDQYTYELKSIVIHSGGPYGGHYYAYIKDDLNEGNWDLQLPEKFSDMPTEVDDRPAHIKAKEAEEKIKEETGKGEEKVEEKKEEETKEETKEEEK